MFCFVLRRVPTVGEFDVGDVVGMDASPRVYFWSYAWRLVTQGGELTEDKNIIMRYLTALLPAHTQLGGRRTNEDYIVATSSFSLNMIQVLLSATQVEVGRR